MNGTEVTSQPRSAVDTDVITGLRIDPICWTCISATSSLGCSRPASPLGQRARGVTKRAAIAVSCPSARLNHRRASAGAVSLAKSGAGGRFGVAFCGTSLRGATVLTRNVPYRQTR